mmetsp:Transcript_25549/g.49983  ORF Transcript_25549/g.49983 Transcript_25549/m.49983 type:complete len:111 (-) Transcript_25549:2093-2425(-)
MPWLLPSFLPSASFHTHPCTCAVGGLPSSFVLGVARRDKTRTRQRTERNKTAGRPPVSVALPDAIHRKDFFPKESGVFTSIKVSRQSYGNEERERDAGSQKGRGPAPSQT